MKIKIKFSTYVPSRNDVFFFRAVFSLSTVLTLIFRCWYNRYVKFVTKFVESFAALRAVNSGALINTDDYIIRLDANGCRVRFVDDGVLTKKNPETKFLAPVTVKLRTESSHFKSCCVIAILSPIPIYCYSVSYSLTVVQFV